MTSDPQGAALRALSQFLVSSATLGETLQRVSQITIDALPAATMAGISLLAVNGKPTTAIFTDEAAHDVDSEQYRSGRGPCLDAWRLKEIVRVTDTADADAVDMYPEFAAAARAHGVGSTLSLPLVAGGSGIGAFNLYADRVDGFSTEDEFTGTQLAAAAAVVLANSSAYWGAAQLSEQLDEAMKSRAVIEQAKGILMARSPEIDADQAFDLLRRASQRENVKLREIAGRIVERKSLSAVPG